MKHFLFSIILLIASSNVARAQATEDVTILQNQSLVVVLKEEEPAKLKKMADKPDKLRDYKAFIAEYNALIRDLAPKIWDFSPSVEFKYESEIPSLLKDKNYQHGLLQHDNFTVFTRAGNIGSAFPTYISDSQTAFSLVIISNGKRRSIGQLGIAPGEVHASDIIFCLKGLQYQLRQRANGMDAKAQMAEQAQNAKKLRTKILLIDEAEIKGTLTDADIKQVYSFPYQIVPRETIEIAARDADARYACVRLFPLTSDTRVHVVMDVADGAMLAMSMPGMSLSGGSVLGKSSLKAFAKAADSK